MILSQSFSHSVQVIVVFNIFRKTFSYNDIKQLKKMAMALYCKTVFTVVKKNNNNFILSK